MIEATHWIVTSSAEVSEVGSSDVLLGVLLDPDTQLFQTVRPDRRVRIPYSVNDHSIGCQLGRGTIGELTRRKSPACTPPAVSSSDGFL